MFKEFMLCLRLKEQKAQFLIVFIYVKKSDKKLIINTLTLYKYLTKLQLINLCHKIDVIITMLS